VSLNVDAGLIYFIIMTLMYRTKAWMYNITREDLYTRDFYYNEGNGQISNNWLHVFCTVKLLMSRDIKDLMSRDIKDLMSRDIKHLMSRARMTYH